MASKKTRFITTGAMIAALYVALCMVFAPVSFGAVQIRVAEALTILPAFTPAAIPGLFIGCLLSNILGGCVVLDIVFGSLATLIGAVGSYYIGRKSIYFAPIAPILSNSMMIPFVLKYGYGVNISIPLLMLFIALGEIIGCGVFGLILARQLSKVHFQGILESYRILPGDLRR